MLCGIEVSSDIREVHVCYMLSPVHLSVCRLSVTLVHPSQAVAIFGRSFGTLAIR